MTLICYYSLPFLTWGNAYGNPCIHEEPREPYRKGDRSTAMGHSHLQGRTHRERILEASRRQKLTATFLVVILDTTAEEEESDATKKGQENSTEENRIGGWIMKEELFSGYECINNVFILLVTPCTLR